MKKRIYHTIPFTSILLTIALLVSSCDQLLDADFPVDKLTNETAFADNNTALSAVSGIYASMMISSEAKDMTNGALGALGGLCADEMYDYTNAYTDYANNDINYVGNGVAVYYAWKNAYSYIYSANLCIEGLTASTTLTPSVKQQLLGECYFIRAFNYFYLTNLYGPVPLITGTDYRVNAVMARNEQDEVYEAIIADLKMAESLLLETYPSADRARANKYTASALLARIYLYRKDYEAAEAKATEVINGPYVFMTDVTRIFLKTSTETIWQMVSVSASNTNTMDVRFYLPGTTPKLVINQQLLDSFEKDELDQDIDLRKSSWIKSSDYQGNTYYYPYKYKISGAVTPATEANIVFRLTEQYLIRAEARAWRNKITEGEEDLNLIRNRAGLKDLSEIVTVDQTSLLEAIEQERKVELFAEWGHRWFDLKRTGRADAVLGTFKPGKWTTDAQLWPVPQMETSANPNLLPNNKGYDN